MTTALLTGVLHRPLHPVEDAAIGWAIDHLTTDWNTRPTLTDVAHLLAQPTTTMAQRAGISTERLIDEIRDARYAITKLLDRDLAGMFDGHTTHTIDWNGRGVVIDTSAVNNTPAHPLVMIAATGWLQQLLAAPQTAAIPRRYQVLEEIWSLLAHPHVARYYQTAQKLSRAYGIANIAIAHRLEDLTAQTDEGSSSAKIGAGILADTHTQIIFHLPPAQAALAAEGLDLPAAVGHRLNHLARADSVAAIGRQLIALCVR